MESCAYQCTEQHRLICIRFLQERREDKLRYEEVAKVSTAALRPLATDWQNEFAVLANATYLGFISPD